MANRSFSLEKNIKTIHGWLGVLILPWIVIIGTTGLYLNHKDLVKSVLPNSHKVDLAVIDKWPDPQAVSMETADRIARDVWPSAIREPVAEARFRSQPVYKIKSDRGSVYVVRATGHYWVQSGLWREFFDPAGNRLNRYFKWTGLFKRLHTDGWLGGALGSWLADIAAFALVIFGMSGLVLFFKPRLRRRRNQRARAISAFPSAGPAIASNRK